MLRIGEGEVDRKEYISSQLQIKPLLNSLFDSFPYLVALIDTDGTILNFSATAARHLGKTPDAIVGLNAFDLPVSSYNISLVRRDDINRIIQSKKPLLLDTAILGDPLYDSLYPVFDSDEQVLQIALAKCSTNSVALENETDFETGNSFRTLVENSPDVICRFDREFRHLYINPSIVRATGLSSAVFLGRSNRDLGLPEGNVAYWEETLREVFETGTVNVIEYDIMTPDGMKHYEARRIPEFGKDGTVRTVLSLCRDITEYRKTVEALENS